jgi:hypothetical protein
LRLNYHSIPIVQTPPQSWGGDRGKKWGMKSLQLDDESGLTAFINLSPLRSRS